MVEASRFLIGDGFRFELRTRELFHTGSDGSATPLPLGSRASDLLLVFLQRPDELVSKDEIMGAVWPNTTVEDNNLRVQISALRQVLDAERGGTSAIATVPGRGYRFTLPVRLEAEPKQEPKLEPKTDPSRAASLRLGGAIALAVLVGIAGAALSFRQLLSSPPVDHSSPALPGVARPFDAASVPLVSDRVRKSLIDYARQPDFKAIALSRVGWGMSTGLPDPVSAERDALDQCRKSEPKLAGDCRIYAQGNQVVWPQMQLPLPADIRAEPLDIPLQLSALAPAKGMPPAADIDAFLKSNNHKALAVANDGGSAFVPSRPDVAEAVRLAVERCSDFVRTPCLLIAVDGFLTVRIPQAHGMVRPYTLAGDTEMSQAERERIGKIYGGADWRALAKGSSGRWYAVNAAASEAAAADQVLRDCQQAEPDCQLRAIGNFRVDER